VRERIVVHGWCRARSCCRGIAEHDIGFAGETPSIRSRDLTATNKILQYLLAGLAVVASDTAGQRECAGQASDAVFLYPSGDRRRSRTISICCSSNPTDCGVQGGRASRRRTDFLLERQERALLDAVARRCRRRHDVHRHDSPNSRWIGNRIGKPPGWSVSCG